MSFIIYRAHLRWEAIALVPQPCLINPFQVHIWVHNYDQGETSLVYANTSSWRCLSFSFQDTPKFIPSYNKGDFIRGMVPPQAHARFLGITPSIRPNLSTFFKPNLITCKVTRPYSRSQCYWGESLINRISKKKLKNLYQFMWSSKLCYKTVYTKTMNLIFLHVDKLHLRDQCVKQNNLWIDNANACSSWCHTYSSIFVCSLIAHRFSMSLQIGCNMWIGSKRFLLHVKSSS